MQSLSVRRPDSPMFEPKTPVPKPDRRLPGGQRSQRFEEPQQRRMMVSALVLLLVALGFVLYRDRDFWFPDTTELADDDSAATSSATTAQPVNANPSSPKASKHRGPVARPRQKSLAAGPPSDTPALATISRTALPPLEVEVVAGDTHRTVHPGTNSVRVDLQPGSPSQSVPVSTAGDATRGTPAVTNAAERVQMSADTSEVVSRSVRPAYPLLARQMKVQGSVVLEALISRQGEIQGLEVVSGPPILAGAAEEAVRQWRFKPHYLGGDSVETQAKITVNFTISTN